MNGIDPETARGLLIIAALLAFSTVMMVLAAYRRGQLNIRRRYFTAILRPDDSVRQRL